jgi:flagellar hook assembly protein FlgD
MNTQLSSWAQLRHDNLLYAKQSYTGGVSCDYPYGYVEPAVEFYAALETLSDMANTKLLASMDKLAQYEDMQYIRSNVRKYFENMQDVAGKLRTISEKEIKGEKLTDSETEFILSVYQERDVVCAVEPSGWYADLYYFKDVEKPDYVVADVHTAPTDAAGNMVGWVWHVGTGPINLMIVRAKDYEGREIAYAGPVLSFYEHVSTNFKRLTDEEWEQSYQMSHGLRPDWTELYLADKDGHNSVANPPMLPTGATEVDRRTEGDIGMTIKPNPMVESSMIVVKLPGRAELYDVDLSIYDMNGRKVAAMFNGSVNGGNYLARWDGTTDTGFAVENGIYVIKLSVGDRVVTGKIAVSK